MTKITEDQLKKITNQQKELTDLLNKVGVLEVQKHNVTSAIKLLSDEIEKTKSELEEEYGSINIDLKDGSYTQIVKDAE